MDGKGRSGHVEMLLGAYVLGGLSEAEQDQVEDHLLSCAVCRGEEASLADIRGALDLLDAAHIADLRSRVVRPVGGFIAPVPVEQLPVDVPVPVSPRQLTLVGASAGRAALAPAPPRRRLAGILAVAAAVVIAAVGVASVALARHGAADSPDHLVTLTAGASDRASGVSARMTVMPRTGGATVEATLQGLTQGQPYRLFAVSGDGTTVLVASFQGKGASQVVRGDIAVTVAQLSFFTVVGAGDTVIVSIPFDAGPRPAET